MPLAPVTSKLRFDDQPDLEVAVHRYVVDEGLSRPFVAHLHITCDAGAPLPAPARTALLGSSATLTLARPGGASRLFAGVVESCTDSDTGDGVDAWAVHITLVPHLALLAHEVASEVFADCTALDIIHSLLSRSLPGQMTLHAAMAPARLLALGRREACVRVDESTLDFVHRLLHEEALGYCLTQSAPGPHVLHVFAEAAALAEVLSPASLDLKHWPGGDVAQESWQNFSVTHRICGRPPEVTVADASQSPPTRVGYAMPGSGNWPLPQGGAASYLGQGLGQNFDGQSYANDVGQIRAQALAQRQETLAWAGTGGTSNALALQPGQRVGRWTGADDGPRKRFYSYWVTDVVHEGGDGDSAYSNTAACLPEQVAYQAAYAAAEPRVQGLHSATVVGAGTSPDPYVDALGRVLVQFNGWGPAQAAAQATPIWVRVAQAWAGAGMGTMFWPRPGMEVWVGFMGASADAPVVLGCAYNGGQDPPFSPVALATRSGWRSMSTGLAGGANELVFEDAVGEEAVTLKSAGEMQVVAAAAMTVKAATTQTTSVGRTTWAERIRRGLNVAASLAGTPAVPAQARAKIEKFRAPIVRFLASAEDFDRKNRDSGLLEAAVESLPEAKEAIKKYILPHVTPPQRRAIVRSMIGATFLLKRQRTAANSKWARKLSVFGPSLLDIAEEASCKLGDSLKAEVAGAVSLDAAKDVCLQVVGEFFARVGAALQLDVAAGLGLRAKGGISLDSGQGVAVAAQGDISQTAPSIHLRAGQSCTVVSGDAAITLCDGVITLRGAQLRLHGEKISVRASKSLELTSPATRIH